MGGSRLLRQLRRALLAATRTGGPAGLPPVELQKVGERGAGQQLPRGGPAAAGQGLGGFTWSLRSKQRVWVWWRGSPTGLTGHEWMTRGRQRVFGGPERCAEWLDRRLAWQASHQAFSHMKTHSSISGIAGQSCAFAASNMAHLEPGCSMLPAWSPDSWPSATTVPFANMEHAALPACHHLQSAARQQLPCHLPGDTCAHAMLQCSTSMCAGCPMNLACMPALWATAAAVLRRR